MIFNYIKNPSNLTQRGIDEKSFWNELPSLFIKLLVVIFFCGLIYSVFSSILNLTFEVSFPDNYTKNFKNFTNRVSYPYLWIIIIGPIIEELTFRLGLNFKKKSFIISSLLIVFVVSGGDYFFSKIDTTYLINISIRVVPLAILYLVLTKLISQENINYVRQKYYSHIIYFSAILFSLLHLPNYFPFQLSETPFYLLTILIFFYISMTLNYIRIRHGLIYAIFFHSFWNGFQYIISI